MTRRDEGLLRLVESRNLSHNSLCKTFTALQVMRARHGELPCEFGCRIFQA
jgi:hypothetical protein